ncbi:MAG TPA: ribosomal protein S18-alanine N-acetyltransferase [Vicinamibacterales bacterium]|nr:ribosomal protein S18-alanine N-acetyltransferase [Vicinamibacterales bacterium]
MTFDRLTSPGDVAALMALDELCFHRPWTRADYDRELADPARCFLYIARAEERIVGYCAFWRIFDEAHINNFAVHPEWRRQGVGRALLAHTLAAAEALGAPRATLEVRASNAAAIALYEAGGFARAGVRRGYYTHPVEDALILWRGAPAPA